MLWLGITHTIAETPAPYLLLVPGGTTTPGQMVDDEILDWIRKVIKTTTWTASVCTGALILWLAERMADRRQAEAIQLTIEYDPHPPFDAGHMSKASKDVQKLAKNIMDERMPADQRRLVPKIAWRRFIDFVRTGK